MRTISEFINEGYNRNLNLTPFEAVMIELALREFLDSGAYEKNKKSGSYYKSEDVEALIYKIKNAKFV
jgi:hypothetical protein